ncbi:ferritin-like domain-containing protein [Chthonobacter rhizosphaerae]|uniref:YciE/YciF ferroxidase family protein n=1 Tax=Chthonobacter rhizosphaerae TaxID=2735553 RepID=UPI0015EF7563|nr:ferritin-like domain-containing protein [Chthonobacter rhizosphaerae]
MAIQSLQDLYLHTLKDIYFAENAILKALPAMIEKSSAQDVKQLLTMHLDETRGQVQHLEAVFKMLGEQASGEECPAIEGIIEEAEDLMGEIQDPDTRDAAIVAAAQAVEHYEITRYGTLVSWSQILGHRDAIQHLTAILDQEKAADKKLTAIAEAKVNQKAA